MPPLDYELVYRVKRERPDLTILVNGGIENLEQAEEHLRHVDGVMMGRAAYQNPVLLTEVDARFFGGAPVDVDAAVDAYADHVARKLAAGAAAASADQADAGAVQRPPRRAPVPPPSERARVTRRRRHRGTARCAQLCARAPGRLSDRSR